MSGHVIQGGAFARGGARATRRAPAGGWVAMVARMIRAIEERRTLAGLDDRMLLDIGLNRLEAEREASRTPWDLAARN